MTLRIAIGGFLPESHSYAPRPTRYEDFLRPGGFPPLVGGPAMIDAVRPTSVASAGAIGVAEAAGVRLVPLAWGFANPAGPVQDEAFERIGAMICAGLSAALDDGPLDGIYLDLHGAAVADSFPDMEGELLRRVRAIAGALPLTVSLDPHCNLTRAMVEHVDALVPYRTYPHVDMRDAGAVVALINDAESAAACHAAGVGARLPLMLGGKSDGVPLQVHARVLKLTDGMFTGTGPMAKGNPAALGPTALIEAAPGIRVIVVTRKMQALDQSLIRHVGIEPAACRIIALKSSVHFRADYGPIAEQVIVAAAPGPVVADPAVLPFKHLRPGLRLRPMDNRTVGQ